MRAGCTTGFSPRKRVQILVHQTKVGDCTAVDFHSDPRRPAFQSNHAILNFALSPSQAWNETKQKQNESLRRHDPTSVSSGSPCPCGGLTLGESQRGQRMIF